MVEAGFDLATLLPQPAEILLCSKGVWGTQSGSGAAHWTSVKLQGSWRRTQKERSEDSALPTRIHGFFCLCESLSSKG